MEFVSLEGTMPIVMVYCVCAKHSSLTSLNGSGMIPMWRRLGEMRENRSKAPTETE